MGEKYFKGCFVERRCGDFLKDYLIKNSIEKFVRKTALIFFLILTFFKEFLNFVKNFTFF